MTKSAFNQSIGNIQRKIDAETLDFLNSFVIFNYYPTQILYEEYIYNFILKTYSFNEIVLNQGEKQENIYLIKSGKIEVSVNSTPNELSDILQFEGVNCKEYKDYLYSNSNIIFENFLNKKLNLVLNTLNEKEIIGFQYLKRFSQNISTVTCKCASSKLEVYALKIDLFFKILNDFNKWKFCFSSKIESYLLSSKRFLDSRAFCRAHEIVDFKTREDEFNLKLIKKEKYSNYIKNLIKKQKSAFSNVKLKENLNLKKNSILGVKEDEKSSARINESIKGLGRILSGLNTVLNDYKEEVSSIDWEEKSNNGKNLKSIFEIELNKEIGKNLEKELRFRNNKENYLRNESYSLNSSEENNENNDSYIENSHEASVNSKIKERRKLKRLFNQKRMLRSSKYNVFKNMKLKKKVKEKQKYLESVKKEKKIEEEENILQRIMHNNHKHRKVDSYFLTEFDFLIMKHHIEKFNHNGILSDFYSFYYNLKKLPPKHENLDLFCFEIENQDKNEEKISEYNGVQISMKNHFNFNQMQFFYSCFCYSQRKFYLERLMSQLNFKLRNFSIFYNDNKTFSNSIYNTSVSIKDIQFSQYYRKAEILEIENQEEKKKFQLAKKIRQREMKRIKIILSETEKSVSPLKTPQKEVLSPIKNSMLLKTRKATEISPKKLGIYQPLSPNKRIINTSKLKIIKESLKEENKLETEIEKEKEKDKSDVAFSCMNISFMKDSSELKQTYLKLLKQKVKKEIQEKLETQIEECHDRENRSKIENLKQKYSFNKIQKRNNLNFLFEKSNNNPSSSKRKENQFSMKVYDETEIKKENIKVNTDLNKELNKKPISMNINYNFGSFIQLLSANKDEGSKLKRDSAVKTMNLMNENLKQKFSDYKNETYNTNKLLLSSPKFTKHKGSSLKRKRGAIFEHMTKNKKKIDALMFFSQTQEKENQEEKETVDVEDIQEEERIKVVKPKKSKLKSKNKIEKFKLNLNLNLNLITKKENKNN